MKTHVDSSWKNFFLYGGMKYHVYALDITEHWDGQYYHTENKFFDIHKGANWNNVCHLKPEIREWLENSVPYMDYRIDHPDHKGDLRLGIRFRYKKHAVLFKLAWA